MFEQLDDGMERFSNNNWNLQFLETIKQIIDILVCVGIVTKYQLKKEQIYQDGEWYIITRNQYELLMKYPVDFIDAHSHQTQKLNSKDINRYFNYQYNFLFNENRVPSSKAVLKLFGKWLFKYATM